MFSNNYTDQKGSYEPVGQSSQTLEQSLVAPEGELPTTLASPMMEVVAPATLSEGYEFEAQLGDQKFKVTVPQGGVEGGQKFMVPLPAFAATNTAAATMLNVPVGHWKDGLCNCFAYGPCHNHCIMAAICPLIAAGQVISRLRLTFWAKPGTIAETTGSFQKICTWTIAYSILSILLGFIDAPYNDGDQTREIPPIIFFLMVVRTLLHYVYLGVLIYVLWNLRYHIRQKYAIPEDSIYPTGCEDLLCAVCCAHCTAAQMMRHTTDYDTYNGTCCTETGVPPSVPSLV